MPVTVEHSVGRVRVLLEQKYTKNASPHVRDHIYRRSIEKEHIYFKYKYMLLKKRIENKRGRENI